MSSEASPAPVSQSMDYTRRAFNLADINVEMGLWMALGLGALMLRIWYLDAAPLNNVEATGALNALALSAGSGVPSLDPFFSNLQSIVMSLFGADAFSARLVAACAGAILCVSPLLLRPALGRTRSLSFALLMAFSPTLLFASRQAGGASLSWALGIVAWSLWLRGTRDARRGAFIALGLLLACGQDAVPPLITLAALLIFEYFTRDPQSRNPHAPISSTGPSHVMETRIHRTSIQEWDILLGVLAFAIASTAAFWRLSGVGDAVNGIALWTGFIPFQQPISVLRLVAGWLLYEPLLYLGAAAALVWLIVNHRLNRREVDWLIWGVIGLVVVALNPARDATGLVPVSISAAAIASVALQRMLQVPVTPPDEILAYPRVAELVVFGLATVMLIYAFMGLDMYGAQRMDTWLFTVLLGLLMVAGIVVVATLTYNTQVAIRGVGMAACLCLFIYTVSCGYQLTQTRAADAAEPYIGEAGDPGLRILLQTVQTISTRAYGDPNTIPLQVSNGAPPALRWVLRNQRGVTYVAHIANTASALTPVGQKPADNASYIGSAFRVTSSTSLSNLRCISVGTTSQLDCTPLARWFTLREIDEQSISSWVFWLRRDIAQKSDGQP